MPRCGLVPAFTFTRGIPWGTVGAVSRRTCGVALVLVLLLVALLAAVVFSFSYAARVRLRLARNRAASLQADGLALAGVEAAKAVLTRDARESQEDSLDEEWATPFPPLTVEGATVWASLVDEDRKINLNSLVIRREATSGPHADPSRIRSEVRARMERAIASVRLPIHAADLARQIVEFVAKGDAHAAPDAEAEAFLGRPLRTMDELLRFDGVTREWLYGGRDWPPGKLCLSDVLTVASTGKVNVNTAPAEVLSALSPKVTDKIADAIIEHRKASKGLTDVQSLQGVPGLPRSVIDEIAPLLSTRSRVFSVTVRIEKGGLHRMVRCLLQRHGKVGDGERMPLLYPDLDAVKVLRWEELR